MHGAEHAIITEGLPKKQKILAWMGWRLCKQLLVFLYSVVVDVKSEGDEWSDDVRSRSEDEADRLARINMGG